MYNASLTACAHVEDEDRANAHLTQERIQNEQRTEHLNKIPERKEDLVRSLPTRKRHVIETTSEKGTSSWLIALLFKSYGFTLTKSKIKYGLRIRYNIEKILPYYVLSTLRRVGIYKQNKKSSETHLLRSCLTSTMKSKLRLLFSCSKSSPLCTKLIALMETYITLETGHYKSLDLRHET